MAWQKNSDLTRQFPADSLRDVFAYAFNQAQSVDICVGDGINTSEMFKQCFAKFRANTLYLFK